MQTKIHDMHKKIFSMLTVQYKIPKKCIMFEKTIDKERHINLDILVVDEKQEKNLIVIEGNKGPFLLPLAEKTIRIPNESIQCIIWNAIQRQRKTLL